MTQASNSYKHEERYFPFFRERQLIRIARFFLSNMIVRVLARRIETVKLNEPKRMIVEGSECPKSV